MTDKLAEAIEKPYKIDLTTGAITIREEILEAACKYHALPVVDEFGIDDVCNDVANVYLDKDFSNQVHHTGHDIFRELQIKYPNGLKFKV